MQRTRQEALDGLLPEQREQLILTRLRAEGRVLASALAAELQTSEHTVRRHLRDLADQGLCKRVYGGALLASPADKPAAVRMGEAVDRKARLAAAAVSIVRPKQIVLLDAGSTNVAIAAALPDHADLTVITNSPEACARLLNRPGIAVILIGGRIATVRPARSARLRCCKCNRSAPTCAFSAHARSIPTKASPHSTPKTPNSNAQ